MRVILTIALNTFREIIRDRILYGLVVFALLTLGLSVALGQLSFSEQARISMDFGFTAIHLSIIVLSIFVGSTLVSKEIDKKTIFTLLVRPISRAQFLIGKSVGLMGVIISVIISLSFVQMLVFKILSVTISGPFFIALWGIFLEGIVILSVSLLFSTFSRPVLVISFAVGVFLIGHWIDNLMFFANKSHSDEFLVFAKFVSGVFPNLEAWNWRSQAVYGEVISWTTAGLGSLYAFLWWFVLTSIGAFILGRIDFD